MNFYPKLHQWWIQIGKFQTVATNYFSLLDPKSDINNFFQLIIKQKVNIIYNLDVDIQVIILIRDFDSHLLLATTYYKLDLILYIHSPKNCHHQMPSLHYNHWWVIYM